MSGMAMHFIVSRLEAIAAADPRGVDPNGFAVAVAVAHHVGFDGRAGAAARARMAALCGKDERSVSRGIAWCRKEKLIEVAQDRERNSTFKSQQYTLVGYAEWIQKTAEMARQKPSANMSSGAAEAEETTASIEKIDDSSGGQSVGLSVGQSAGHIGNQTSIRTSLKPEEEREARERDPEEQQKPDDPKKFERRVKRIAERCRWPHWADSSTAWTVSRFAELTDAERAEAESRAAAYIAHCKAPLSLGTYFAERKWRDLPPEVLSPPPKPAYAPAFGPVWGAIRLRLLVLGPQVPTPLKAWEERAIAEGTLSREATEKGNRMRNGWPRVNGMHQAAEMRGAGVSGHGPAEEALGAMFEPVPVGSVRWEEWRALHEQRGWPWLPDPGKQRVVYFPAGGPAAMEAFEQAVRGEDDAARPQAAE